jgi:cyanophycin synthetase
MALAYVLDSRRLSGRSLLLDAPGAILEVAAPSSRKSALLRDWRAAAKSLLTDLGWPCHQVVARDHGQTQLLALSAPVDGLLVATYLAEFAWEWALAKSSKRRDSILLQARVELLSRYARRANPRLLALQKIAQIENAQLLFGDDDVSVGEGGQTQTYPLDRIPLANSIDWPTTGHKIPTALVTGTNGKTTTVRLLAAMCRAAGLVTGMSSTEDVRLDDEIIATGDYSGPGGARMVLRHAKVQAAVLEIARGGLLRRGIAVQHADVGVITNIGDDHLDENGIHTLTQMASAKALIVKGLHDSAPIVLNADDRYCVALARKMTHPIIWFTRQAKNARRLLASDKKSSIYFADVANGIFQQRVGSRWQTLIKISDIYLADPAASGDYVSHNLENALAAIAAAKAMKIANAAIAKALRSFGRNVHDNLGRMNVLKIRGAMVVVDFAHNTEGLQAVFAATENWPRKRLLVAFGQSGDRAQRLTASMCKAVAAAHPQKILIKEMPDYYRGKKPGELPAQIARELRAQGIAKSALQKVGTDVECTTTALDWLQPGDLAVLFIHAQTDEVMALLRGA